jgi:colanic acid biosynthesis glycosyl transferase WcaI
MNILILAQHYAPEEVSGAVLATELAEDLARRGHQVTFVTCAPSYPQGVVYPGYKNSLFARQNLRDVAVIRAWSYISPHKTFWRRILNYGTFSLGAFFAGLLAEKPDVILSASPPLPLGLAAYLLSRLRGAPWVLRVEDLYPDAAVSAGVLKNRLAIRFFYWLEKFLYRKAAHISLISHGFQRILEGKGVPRAKTSVLPVWADPDIVRPMPKDNAFAREHGLENAFVVMYSGNLGMTSSLEELVRAAGLLRERPGIRFVVVGEGVKKAALLALAGELRLENLLFLPFQPRAVFSEMLASADAGVVTLNQDSSNTSLPSKVFNVMSSERPVLAVANPESELAELVAGSACGLVVAPGDPQSLAAAILRLQAEPALRQQMGQTGRQRLIKDFSRERCVGLYETTMAQARREFTLWKENRYA